MIAQLDGRWIVLRDDDTAVSFDNALSIRENYESAQQIQTIALRFIEVLRAWLSKSEFDEMKALNETDSKYAWPVCASHNYCDSNMAMAEAFESVMGYVIDGDNEPACVLWGDAWTLARKLELGWQ